MKKGKFVSEPGIEQNKRVITNHFNCENHQLACGNTNFVPKSRKRRQIMHDLSEFQNQQSVDNSQNLNTITHINSNYQTTNYQTPLYYDLQFCSFNLFCICVF